MTNAVINNIVISEDELYNRVKAYGAGDGINRAFVTVEDASSITAYGVREVIQEFSDAITFEEVEEKALEFLDFHKEPVTEIDVTFYFDVEKGPGGDIFDGKAYAPGGQEVEFYRFGDDRQIRRGDTIRIVSQTLNLNTTGIVEELSWQPGSVNLSIGQKRYNLIDVIKGPDAEQERKTDRKSPEVPLGLRVQRAEPGITLFVNPYFSTSTVGIEVYVGDAPGFAVGKANLLVRSGGNRFDFNQLEPGRQFYFRVRAYDNRGNFSPLSEEVTAISGTFPGEKIQGGTIEIDKFVPDARPIVVVTALPVVPPGDTVYTVGMLVNYLGSLYRLVSQTSTPAADWVRAIDNGSLQDGAVDTTKIAANTILAQNIDAGSVRTAILISDVIKTNMIDAGQVTSAKIGAGEVKAVNIEASTITTGKLNSGNVIIDNGAGGDGPSNRIRVLNDDLPTPSTAVVMGNIAGLDGVPSGTSYGFWGKAGANTFIEGQPRVLATGIQGLSGDYLTPISLPSSVPGSRYTHTAVLNLLPNSGILPIVSLPTVHDYIFITLSLEDFFVSTAYSTFDIGNAYMLGYKMTPFINDMSMPNGYLQGPFTGSMQPRATVTVSLEVRNSISPANLFANFSYTIYYVYSREIATSNFVVTLPIGPGIIVQQG